MVLLKRIPTVGFALPLALLHMFYSVLKAHSTPLPERADERLASHVTTHDALTRRVAVRTDLL